VKRLKPVGLPLDAGKQAARIAVPVGFEFFLVLALTLVNQIIVGGLGATAIAAVGFANSIHTIPLFFLGALNVGAGVVVGRAYGGGNRSLTNRAVSFSVLLSLVSGIVVALPFVFFPSGVLELSGASSEVVSQGSGYLGIVLLSLPAGVLAMVLGSVLRSVDRSRSPMWATIVAVVINIPLAIVLVYGAGPIPALGVFGAGLAFFITTIIRAIVLAAQVFLIFDVANWKLPGRLHEWTALSRPILMLAVPMALTSLSWTFGGFFYNVAVQRLGDDPLAALQIVFTLSGVFVVGSIGLGSAITVLASQAIGRGDPVLATTWVTYLLRLGVVTGIFFAALFAGTIFLLPVFYPEVSAATLAMAGSGILIAAAVQPLSVRMLLLASVLPAGNDTTGIIIGDFVGPYFFGLPITIGLGLFTPLGMIGAIIGKAAEDVAKLIIFSRRAKKISWDVVLENHEETLLTIGDLRTGPITLHVLAPEGDPKP